MVRPAKGGPEDAAGCHLEAALEMKGCEAAAVTGPVYALE